MEEQLLGMDNASVEELRGKQQSASSSVGQMVALGDKIIQFDIDGILRDKVKGAIPLSCPTSERLTQSYSIDLACAFIVSNKSMIYRKGMSSLVCIHKSYNLIWYWNKYRVG